LYCLLALTCAGSAIGASAQTAHFSYALSAIGSGFANPLGVAMDSSGNIYVGDYGNNAVKEVPAGCTSAGCIVTLPGTYNNPMGVAVDSNGNVYVADNGASEILEIPSGCSTSACVVALGTGFNNPTDVAVDGSGNVYVADTYDSAVKEMTPNCTSAACVTVLGGTFTFNTPQGVNVDASGNVYVADRANNQIEELTPNCTSSACVTVLGGTGTFLTPQGVAVDPAGNVFVSDTGNGLVREMTPGCATSSCVTTLASDSKSPTRLVVDPNGNVIVADYSATQITDLMLHGVNFNSVAIGSSSAALSLTFTFDTAGTMSAPAVLMQGAAGLDFADAGSGTCTTNGTAHAYAQGDTCTVGVVFTPTQAGTRYGAAVLSDAGGATMATGYVYGTGVGPQIAFSPATQSLIGSGLSSPYGVAVDGSGNVYIADYGNSRVLKETLSGGSYTQSTIGTGLGVSAGVAVDGSGNVYIADYGNNSVLKETPSGGSYTQSTIATGLGGPTGVAVDGSGNVYIADYGNSSVLKETLSGGSYTQSTISTGLGGPFGVAVDGSGNVYIADSDNNRVLKETLSGGSYAQSTIGTGLGGPFGVAVDGIGNVYIADSNYNRVLKETLSGGSYTQSTISTGLTGDSGVAVDGSGNVYIGDTGTSRVLKEDVVTPPSLNFASTQVGVQSTDSPQTVTITNGGTAALSFPVPGAGNNPSISTGFALDSATTCPQLNTSSGSAGTLAAGASCNDEVDFIPTVPGANSGQLILTDTNLNASPSTTQTISLAGLAASVQVSPATLPAGTVGAAYSQPITGSGGTAPYTYSVSSGSLPSGLTLNAATGDLSGTPTAGGSFSFAITATDSASQTGAASYTLAINAPTIIVSPATLPNPSDSTSYSQTITASGGTASYTYAISAGALPTGLTLNASTGVVAGTPTAIGTFSFTVTATDSSTGTGPYSGSQAYSVTISQSSQTITFSNPGAQNFGTAPTLTATASSGLTVSFTSATTGVCTVTSGGALTFVTAGTCTIDADQAGNTSYSAAPQVAQSFTVNAVAPGAPTIGTATAGDAQATVSFTAPGSNGGAAITSFAATSSPGGLTGTCASSPCTVTGLTNGTAYTFTVTATNSASAGTASAASNSVTPKGSQTITFANPGAQNFGTTPTLTGTASSGLTVSFTSATTGVCTVTTGGILTFVTAGTCTIDADQAGNTAYSAAPQVAQSFSVVAVVPNAPTAVTAAAGSGQVTVSFTAPSNDGGASITSYTVTSNPGGITATGAASPIAVTGLTLGTAYTFTVTANNSAGTGTVSAASNSVTLQGSQTITFPALSSPVTYGASPISLAATASSGLAVSYAVTGPATASGSTLTITGAGSVVVTASQAGNSSYTAATPLSQTIAVNPAHPSVGGTAPTLSYGQGGSSTVTVTGVTGGAVPTGTITYAIDGGSAQTVSMASGMATVPLPTTLTQGSHSLALTYGGDTNYAAASGAVTFSVGQASLNVAAHSATRVYGTANPTFTGTVTGAVNGDSFTESFATTATTSSNVGQYSIVPSVTGANLSSYTVVTQNGTLDVTQAGTTTTLAVSSASVTPGQSVTLTAQVASATTGTPTGTVDFYDGTTMIGSRTLTAGAASLNTTALSAGATHTITAAYSGDTNFQASSTTATTSIVVAPLDFTFTLTGSTSQTVSPGGSASFQGTVDPLYGNYAGQVNFSVSGLPPGATFTVNPATIDPTGGQQTVTLTIQTAAATAAEHAPPLARKLAPLTLAFLILPLFGFGGMRRQGRRLSRMVCLLILVGGFAATAAVSGCGSGSPNSNTTPSTYTVTITATAGSITHSAVVSLEVK
jgi:DNA-binding beta-propeller fold protein YncE